MSDTKDLIEAMEVPQGTPVLVRSAEYGVGVGRLHAARGAGVVLRDAVHLRTWSGTGKNNGSCYDLIEQGTAIRDAEMVLGLIREVGDIWVISEERYEDLRTGPRHE